MHLTLRARSRPYYPPLRHDERICTRCGIQFKINASRDRHTECRDCREIEEP